jgi:hypothetical protein
MGNMNDKLNKKLKESWKQIQFDFINEESIRFKGNKSFDEMMQGLFERENDKPQIDSAVSLYNKILHNANEVTETEYKGYPAYDLTQLLNEPFVVIFAGNKLGTVTLDINGTKTLVLVVGSEVYRYLNTINNNLYKFWVENKSFIIHELIHLNDYKRVKTIKKSDLTNANTYYNNPLEFNAYYLEIAHDLYAELRNSPKLKKEILQDRNVFLKFAWGRINQSIPNIKDALTEAMLFKWNKRLYQLFDELREHFDIKGT